MSAPDRVREAASARRRELAATRHRLAGGHRADLRAALELARLSCAAGLAADLDELTRRAGERTDGAGRAARAELPSWLAGELHEVRRRSTARAEATAGPAVRRIAAGLCPGAAPMPLPDATGAPPVPPSPRRVARAAVPADPRMLAAVAGLPVLGAGGLGLAAVLTAAGVVLLLAVLAHARAGTAARARSAAETARTVAAARADAERALARRLIEVERGAGAALDRAVAGRRALLDDEIAQVCDASR